MISAQRGRAFRRNARVWAGLDDARGGNWLACTNLTGTGAKVQAAVPLTAARRFFRVSQP